MQNRLCFEGRNRNGTRSVWLPSSGRCEGLRGPRGQQDTAPDGARASALEAEPLHRQAGPAEQEGLGVPRRGWGCGLGWGLLPSHSETLGVWAPAARRQLRGECALQRGDRRDDGRGRPGPGRRSSPGPHAWEGSSGLPRPEPRGGCLLPGPGR